MTPGRRRFLSILLIIVIVAGVGVATFFLFFNDADKAMRIKKLGGEGLVGFYREDYKESSLRVYPYGAFEIEIIYKVDNVKETIFVGVGTYTKTKEKYTFTYADSFGIENGFLEQKKDYSVEYAVGKDGRICFDYQGILYYFGR